MDIDHPLAPSDEQMPGENGGGDVFNEVANSDSAGKRSHIIDDDDDEGSDNEETARKRRKGTQLVPSLILQAYHFCRSFCSSPACCIYHGA